MGGAGRKPHGSAQLSISASHRTHRNCHQKGLRPIRHWQTGFTETHLRDRSHRYGRVCNPGYACMLPCHLGAFCMCAWHWNMKEQKKCAPRRPSGKAKGQEKNVKPFAHICILAVACFFATPSHRPHKKRYIFQHNWGIKCLRFVRQLSIFICCYVLV